MATQAHKEMIVSADTADIIFAYRDPVFRRR